MTRNVVAVKMFMKKTNTPRAGFITKASETFATRDKNFIVIRVSARVARDSTKKIEIPAALFSFRIVVRINYLARTKAVHITYVYHQP